MNLKLTINCKDKSIDKLYDFALDTYKELDKRGIPILSMELIFTKDDLSSNKE